MARIKHYTQLIIFDTLAVICMVGALLTGWLPGPGGIPLFLVGLSLLAINHEWAERYIESLKKYADRLGDFIFVPRLRLFFDIIAPLLVAAGAYLIYMQTALWMISAGVFCIGFGLLFALGNRNRWVRIKQKLKKKH